MYFAGSWNMLIDGDAVSVRVTQTGNTVSGIFTIGTVDFKFSGTVSADGQTVNGTWQDVAGSGSYNGPFVWQLKKNINQFVGSITNTPASYTGPWCGYRSGASAPSPCLYP